MRRGIPTVYAGIRFRSRVEARWAAMFDQFDWRWEYEPLDLDGYIPDFVLTFHKPLLVEIKSELTIGGLVPHCRKIEMSGWEHEALLLGATPVIGNDVRWHDQVSFGLLAERYEGPTELAWTWDDAFLFRCRECHKISLLHDSGGWDCRVTGCYDGDHHLSPPDLDLVGMWRMAHAHTAWKGAA